MGETRRFAVILVRHDTTKSAPSVADCRAALLTGDFAVVKYWRENTDDWLDFAAFDFYGWYDVMLPPPPSHRMTISTAAYNAAVAAGANLDGYDSFIVLSYPGTAYDGGTWSALRSGDPRPCCTVPTTDSHTILCHEVGHVLGFPDSNGIFNTAADWTNDGVAQTYPYYGDPYDIMSAEKFGGSAPTFALPASEMRTNVLNIQRAGPMLSRALLHVIKPIALEAQGRVTHIQEGADSFVTLYPAGRGGQAGDSELICFHPIGEDAQGRGRVYIEYRQCFSFNFRSRWDQGLGATGSDDLDRAGIIVHSVRDYAGTPGPLLWYEGRIVFPAVDADLLVPSAGGTVAVKVSSEYAASAVPAVVRVSVSRQSAPRVIVRVQAEDVATIIHTEKRKIPGWEFAGEFSWERRAIVTTARFTPISYGRGGTGTPFSADNVTVRWYAPTMFVGPGVTTVNVPGGPGAAQLTWSIEPASDVLTLINRASDGPYSLKVECHVLDTGNPNDATIGVATFETKGVEEGWGEDYDRYMDFWHRITNPIPKHRVGPPRTEEIRAQIRQVWEIVQVMEALNPQVAAAMTPMAAELERSQLMASFESRRTQTPGG